MEIRDAALVFPNGFDPRGVIFVADRVQEGPLCPVRNPLRALTAHENEVGNVVSFSTDGIAAQLLQRLAVH
jgi:hypothetical protein